MRAGSGIANRGNIGMDEKLCAKLVESMEEMNEIARGEREPAREFYIDPLQIKKLRGKVGLSQPRFAKVLGIDAGTLRNWEQGRREPTGPAKALLHAIAKDPKNVLKALAL